MFGSYYGDLVMSRSSELGLRSVGRKFASLAAIAGFEALAIVVLHRLGQLQWMQIPWDSVASWLELAPTEDVVAAGLRVIALAIAYWIAASTALYTLARLTRLPGLIRATAWATLPPIRRAIDRAIAVTVTTTALVSPVAPALAADEVPPAEPIIYQISDQGVPTPVNPPTIDPTLISPPGTAGAGYTPTPAGGVEIGADIAAAAAETVYEVVKGDNLWTISAKHLQAAAPDREVDAAAISIYWRKVIELNTPNLTSGDPNLIYPGEQIVLPAIDSGDEV